MNSTKIHWSVTILLCLGLSTVGFGWTEQGKEKKEEGEKKVEMKDLPKPVQQTVQQQSKGATLVGLTKEVENGKTYYEAEMKVNGRAKDILIDPKGNVVEVEEQMELTSLPANLRAEIKKSVRNGKILKLESVTKGGTLTGYEAQVETAGKKSEIAMDPNGKLLAPEKKKS